jgi:L-ascorbate metabolism protein UlaG (beta-lactamase superfamily)
MKQYLILYLFVLLIISCVSKIENSEVIIHPISHGSLVIEYGDEMIYIDPVGKPEVFNGLKKPTVVVITDIHGDHLNLETLDSISDSSITLVIPKAVAERLNENIHGERIIMNNGDKTIVKALNIEAIPMYNLREEALEFHKKGRGNGYVIGLGDERIYISGDTEDIIEMRSLTNIDKAFVCMNLPWTMTIDSAADAVLEFKPKEIYPYHYRGTDGMSDIESFKSIVNSKNNNIKVNLINWYSQR